MIQLVVVLIYTWEPQSQFFSIFCHYGFVGWIEGPIWRTQIRSVNAREVEKKLWVFIGFLSILFGFFLANCWVECAFGPTLAQSSKVNQIDMFFPSNATYFQSR